jgi:hypothetical protein
MSTHYKAALDSLADNPDVLLDLNKDIFCGTTPMEHLQLLLQFMNSQPNEDLDILPRAQMEIPIQPTVNTSPTSHGFYPDIRGFWPLQNICHNFAANAGMFFPPLPLFPYLQNNYIPAQYLVPPPNLFCWNNLNAYGFTADPMLSTWGNGKKMMVEKRQNVKSDFRDSKIFPGLKNNNEGNSRFVHPSLDVNGMISEPPVSNTYKGFFNRRSIPKVGQLRTTNVNAQQSFVYDEVSNNLKTTSTDEHQENASKIHFGKRSFETKKEIKSKPYTCLTCSKKFKQKCHLNRHLRMHTGVKRFFCLTCNHGFYQRSNLRAHVRTHASDDKISHSFACMLCTKRYTRKHSLMKHLERHTKV